MKEKEPSLEFVCLQFAHTKPIDRFGVEVHSRHEIALVPSPASVGSHGHALPINLREQ